MTTETSPSRRIVIFDTTLRDGEQSPGASMNLNEKMEIAEALAELGVDVIEAGFPIASPGDFEAVREISNTVRGPIICGLARCREEDIDRAWEAIKLAERPRIHVFLATSAIHREHKLRMTKEDIVRHAVAGVKRAVGYCPDVEFSPEDAARTEIDFLCEVVEAAIAAGATTVNIPDTVGYATPALFGNVIRVLRQRVPNIDRAVISVHCHNDLGLAVSNSLGAVENGAGQVECTINGIGERNKAIVGENAFAHEAGIHQDGMLKERTTYEIMRPEDVGFSKTDLVLGKHSGRAALADRAKVMGYRLTGEQLDAVFEQFKVLADKKKEIYDADVAALIEQQLHVSSETFALESYQLSSGTGRTPEVTITIRRGQEVLRTCVAAGDGPIDAVFLAIEDLTGISEACNDFRVHSVTVGKDAKGEVTVQLENGGQLYRGRGVSTYSVEASARAFLNAINRIAAAAATT